MEKSETINKLLAKIAVVSNEMDALIRNAENPFFKSKYVPLEEVQSQLEPKLKANDLGVSQPLFGKGIMTIISDKTSGEWLALPSEINAEHLKPQDQMSGVTYMKRYALVGLFNLQIDKDDDGEKTREKTATVPTQELPTIRR